MSVFTGNVSSPPSNSQSGWVEIADTETTINPLSQSSVNGGDVILTNDGLGPDTELSFNLTGIGEIWNSTTNTLNFVNSGLILGDNILTKINVELTPDIVPQKISIIYNCFSGADGTGSLVGVFKKEIGEISSDAGVPINFIEESRFHLDNDLVNGSCKIHLEGTSRFSAIVSSFNFLIIRTS